MIAPSARTTASLLAVIAFMSGSCRPGGEPDGWADTVAEPYAPERLRAAVGRIDEWLAANNPVAAGSLQPGLDSATATARLAADGCVAPREVLDFFDWRNGMRADTDVPFVWYHRFMSVDDAVERRRTYRNPVLRMTLPLPDAWLPLFEFEGEYYFTRCQAAHGSAVIWHWSGEEPETRIAFRSLTAMLETAAEWYEQGAVWVVDPVTGALDMDIQRVHAIHVARNPDATFPYFVPGG